MRRAFDATDLSLPILRWQGPKVAAPAPVVEARIPMPPAAVVRARYALTFLFLVGVVQVLWGIVGPYASGPTAAEVLIERLGLERDPDTYTDVGIILTESQQRRGIASAVGGFAILLAAGYGLYVTSEYDRHARRPS